MVRQDDSLTDAEHIRIATEMYERWQIGDSKSRLEIEYWDDSTAHGKAFTSYIKRWLGHQTEKESSQTVQITRLESLLRINGISPTIAGDLAEEYRLLAKSRESALAAVRVYNDPMSGYRSEVFIVLMIIAWNSLFQAILEKSQTDYYERDQDGCQILIDDRPKVLDTVKLIGMVLTGREYRAVRKNLEFFMKLRNLIAHRYLPALDIEIAGEAQAMLLNYEELLVLKFGDEAAIGDRLTVPLQLSEFRHDHATLTSLKKAQSRLPTDVTSYLANQRIGIEDEILKDRRYCFNIFLVPITANRESSADAIVQFISPDRVTPELEAILTNTAVVIKPKTIPVASDDLLRPREVVNLVVERLPYRFTMDTHTRCWKYYKVRPPSNAKDPHKTIHQYCIWDRVAQTYGYTKAWVDKLVRDLSDANKYESVAGRPPNYR